MSTDLRERALRAHAAAEEQNRIAQERIAAENRARLQPAIDRQKESLRESLGKIGVTADSFIDESTEFIASVYADAKPVRFRIDGNGNLHGNYLCPDCGKCRADVSGRYINALADVGALIMDVEQRPCICQHREESTAEKLENLLTSSQPTTAYDTAMSESETYSHIAKTEPDESDAVIHSNLSVAAAMRAVAIAFRKRGNE